MSLILSPQHIAELQTSALTPVDIDKLKMWSGNKEAAKRLTGYSIDGLLIPYFDPFGVPLIGNGGGDYYRIKPNYSPGIEGDKPKYLSPKGVGNRLYYPQNFDWPRYFEHKKRQSVIIVEGEKTAAALCAAGYPAVGLIGVSGWRDKASRTNDRSETPAPMVEDDAISPTQLDESRPIPEMEELISLLGDGSTIIIMFDSDISQKFLVRLAAKKLAIWLNDQGCIPMLCILPNEIDGTKNGADDLIYRHGRSSIEVCLKNSFRALRWKDGTPELNIPEKPDLKFQATLATAAFMQRWAYRAGYGWYKWNGSRWTPTDDGLGTYLDKDIISFFDAQEWRNQTNGVLNGITRHLKAQLSTPDHLWQKTNYVCFQNGVLELNSQTFRAHLPTDYNINLLTYDYDPTATAPNWLNFISQALGADQLAINLVQALFQWALTPKTEGKLKLEICWDLYGRPGTGKGTTLETLRNLVGRKNVGTFKTGQLNNPNYLASLKDKTCSISADDSGHLDDVGQFAEIITNESVNVKLLYQNPISCTLNTFLIRAYNDFPTTTGSNNSALDRRLLAMSFDHQPQTRDVYLQDRLNSELPGIFNWAYAINETEMIQRVQNAGSVAAVAKASIERFTANNPVITFLEEEFPNGNPRAKPREVYQQYAAWSRDTGRIPLNQRQFGIKMEAFGCHRTGKLDGIYFWVIPAIECFDALAHLKLNNTSPSPVATPPPAPQPDQAILIEPQPIGQPRIEVEYTPDKKEIKKVLVWVLPALAKEWQFFVARCGFTLMNTAKTGQLIRLSIGRVTAETLTMLQNQNPHYAPS